MRDIFCGLILILFSCCQMEQPAHSPIDLSPEERARDLVRRMSLEEKILQLGSDAPAIPRLGLRAYHYQGEALHGLAEAYGGRLMRGTSFPQSIAMGSTWNPVLLKQVATAISDEARGYYNAGELDLTFWSPNINMLRDPRWGRNDEAYSEDPYLMSRMAVAFTQGMQGDHPKYLKTIITPKHFVANNSEYNRHDGSSNVSERWLREYYFPAFKAAFTEGGAYSTMCAYNRVNEVPACGDPWLLTQVLRQEWGFEGYVVSDCGAISDIIHQHKYTENEVQAVAAAMNAGMDLECEGGGDEQLLYEKYLKQAVDEGLVDQATLDDRVVNVLKSRMLLGDLDPKEAVPYTSISKEVVESKEHQALALKAARESIILLKNEGRALPLAKHLQSIAVIGPNANKAVLGAYSGKPTHTTSVLEGIQQKVGDEVEIVYEKGCAITFPNASFLEGLEEWGKYVMDSEREEYEMILAEVEEEFGEDDDIRINRAVELAKKVDQVVLVMGTGRFVSNEESDAESLSWPGRQQELIQRVTAANSNVVLVLVNGFPITMNWEKEHVPAIVESWYAGQAQGTAMADVLFGDYNPGGKLPITWYQSETGLPPIGDYDITKGRTYWFYEGEVLFPFGFGLSYTRFELSQIELNPTELAASAPGNISVQVNLTNLGEKAGDEVVQLYIKDLESSVVQPEKRLRKFQRVSLESGETQTITFTLSGEDFSHWDEETEQWTIEPGDFEIQLGTSSSAITFRETLSLK